MPRTYEESMEFAREISTELFPDDEYTIVSHMWCDGDYKIVVKHGFGQSEEGGARLREEIVVTPFIREYRIVEATQSEKFTVHKSEVM